jgi:hypothetical protein
MTTAAPEHRRRPVVAQGVFRLSAGVSLRFDSIQRQIEFEHVHSRLAEQACRPFLDMGGHESVHHILRKPARGGDARNLKIGRVGRNIRIEAAARSGDEVDGTGVPGFCFSSAASSAFTRAISLLLVGPRLEPPELEAS